MHQEKNAFAYSGYLKVRLVKMDMKLDKKRQGLGFEGRFRIRKTLQKPTILDLSTLQIGLQKAEITADFLDMKSDSFLLE